ncbi:MAG: CoB--CoM heterodisulfide reductase iron-sulfur subunit A family protein [Chloroflexi bacterium]|nr:CoB--CoM heterodisulfide reductase iron-sulfur subunit A family protein [Chloroflexota bacterium]
MEERTESRVPDNRIGDVMVIGAGVSGIQAALDLAGSGFKVYLVDKEAAIGGKMAQLDKTFPTNDCSMCILSPKFIECFRHPNIKLLTYHEVDGVEGAAGDFTVTLTKKPRYVKDDLCLGCPTCVRYCPVKIPDKYNQNLSSVKAIYLPFPQAVPNVFVIDREACLFFQKKCKSCVPACRNKAIDFYMEPEKVEVKVGAVILAPGYETFDPRLRADYGYGRMKNVVTSLDFERVVCASGPYSGEILRPSDRKHPKRIAWLQCVGSRQVTPGGNSYCSAVCCMYATKQAILAKEHDAGIEATIFHNDIRAYGKDFERFYRRAASLPGVRYIRSYVTMGKELPNGNVTIKYSFDESEVKEEEFDLVVLSVGLTPPAKVEELAGKLSIELNQHQFCSTDAHNPLKTSRPGVFTCGAFQRPMDIPESVMSASGAAALCGELLAERRGQLAREREYPPERDVSGQEPKVGVFACRCGTNIGSVVDVPSLVQYASKLGNVAHVEESLYACSADTAKHIAETIRDKGINAVVVAACTPRTHESLFQDTLREAGINKYLFVMANVREHCSWVHAREKEMATQKAKDIARMAVARAAHLQPLEELEVPVSKRALVIGGGLSGMTCALSLANQGFEVHLVEKDSRLGGMARKLHFTLEGIDVQAYLRDLIQKVGQHPLVRVSTGATVIGTSGYVGNFTTRVMSEVEVEEVQHGVTIIATGAEEYRPSEYLYGQDDRVLTLLELEERIAGGDASVAGAQSLVMVQCVGCRDENRPYCSRVCCGQAIKCALKLKEVNPQRDIYILYRDMMTYGFKEDYYREAADREVKFIRYEPEDKPQVEAVEENGRSVLRVTVTDPVLGKRLAIDADMLALAAAVVPSSANNDISRLFKLPLNQDNFFLEAHAKLRPVDFAADGIFLCGTAHYPKDISEAISQAYGAAGRAATILSKDTIKASGVVAEIDKEKCNGCQLCVQACYFGAISFNEQLGVSEVNPVLCKGCGNCAVVCPSRACQVEGFRDGQVLAQVEAYV